MRSISNCRGQSIVEISLITPLLLVALYVPFDFGVAFFVAHLTQNAVREGARVASITTDLDNTKAGNVANNVYANLPEWLASGSPATKDVTVTLYATGAADCVQVVEVKARGTYNFFWYRLIGFVGLTPPGPVELPVRQECVTKSSRIETVGLRVQLMFVQLQQRAPRGRLNSAYGVLHANYKERTRLSTSIHNVNDCRSFTHGRNGAGYRPTNLCTEPGTGRGGRSGTRGGLGTESPGRQSSSSRSRAAIFNSKNNFVGSKVNQIDAGNISYVKYDFATNQITNYSETFANANGVRVGLEQTTGSGIKTPVYLTPLFNLLGVPTSATQNVNVSAVAVVSAIPTLPIAIYNTQCTAPNPIKIRATDDPNETGCWTTFFDGSTSKPDVVGLMQASGNCNGIPQGANVGDSIHLNDGNQKPDYDAAKDLFTANPTQCWIVPVVAAPSASAKTNNCNQWQPILDFASICPIEVVSTKSPKYIKANVTCGQTLDSTSNNLCFSHRLVREKEAGKAY